MIKAKNDQKKRKNMKSTKPTEIKLLIFGGSTENAITKNTSKKK